MTCDDDKRARERLDFVRRATGQNEAPMQRAGSDAGSRSYWRVAGGNDSRIVMDAPPVSNDLRPWLALRELLEVGGVRVPHVLASDADAGFLLLEDLGTRTLLDALDEANAEPWFNAALAQLLKLQTIAPPDDLPRYDTVLLTRELRLFDDWFLARHLGLTMSSAARHGLDSVYRLLIDAASAQPQVLVHRDFMPRNLMPLAAGDVAVIDFQDAVRGPISYDVLSLFRDAFLSWPEPRVAAWLANYHARGIEIGRPLPALDAFRRDVDLIGVHRHLKVLGIFARLRHRDGKPGYLDDAPRFIAYLDAVIPRHPELAPLGHVLDTTIKPALARRTAEPAP